MHTDSAAAEAALRDYAEAFAPDEAAPETTLMRRLRTGQQ